MPHKPNPIPRFQGSTTTKSNRQIQDRIPPVAPDSSSPSLHQSDNTHRHRTDSWASQSSAGHDTAARTPMPSAPSSSGHSKPSSGGGRAGGRALPPPRFQRKQRPPRVQQAIAAANAASAASGTSGPSNSRRGGGPPAAAPSTAAMGVGGTLTLGPANNWGAGTTSVTSLPMSAVNAASARGSVIHRFQSRPTITNSNLYPTSIDALDRNGPFILEGGLQPDTHLLLDGLDPVQLHNRLTMGSAAGSNETGFIPAYTQFLPEMSYGPADVQTSPAKNLGTSHATRPRSQSHNVAQPVGAFNAPLTHLPTSITSSSQSYGLSHGLEQNSGLHSPDLQPYQNVQQHLRNRSRSLITESQLSNMISVLPPVRSMPHSAGAEGFGDLVHSPGQFTAPPYSAAEQHPTPPPAKRPLKSALKVRKSAPEFIDTSLGWHDADARLPLSHGFNNSSSSFNASSSSLDTGSLGSSFNGLQQTASHSQLSLLPDPHFILPDSLQAQYAHQLRLLQEEYSQKAAKAERLRQRVAQRQSGMRGNVQQINTTLANMQIHDNPSHELLHVSPPSSGGGSGSGHRVSFDEGVEVIGMSSMDPSAYHDGSGVTGSEGYVSWDEEWEEPVDAAPHEDDTFDYAYADGFGNGWMDESNGAVWPTEDTTIRTLRPLEEEDGRSDVGEGGHDVADPSRMRVEDFDSMMSPIEPIMLSASNRDIDLEQASFDAVRNLAEESVPVIQVEVIAPTPPRATLELDAVEQSSPPQPQSQEAPEQQVSQPPASADKEAQPPSSSSRSSTEEGSSASSDSNRTLKHQSESPSDSDPTPSASVRPPLSDKPNVTLPSAKDRAPILESPAVHAPQPTRIMPPGEPIQEPVFPRPLQRLAQRVSRGTAHGLPPPLPPPNEPLPNVAFPNTQARNLSSPDLRLQQVGRVEDLVNHSMHMRQRIPSDPIPPANHLPPGDIYDRTLRRNRGMSNTIPIPSFDPDPLYPSNAQMENSSVHQMDHASMLPDLYAFPHQEQQIFPPFAPARYGTSRKHNLAIADISSATSVESGSSHGGGTSGGSHSHRSFKRSNAGSIMSHSSSSGLDLPHRSVPHPGISNPAPLDRATARPSPNSASIEGHEMLTNQALSNAISMESLRPVSISSGKSAGSSGSGNLVRKPLGGDSIWTLGKEEEAGWPSVPPTFAGHLPRANPQYTLQSLLPTSPLSNEIEQTEKMAQPARAGDGRFRAPNPSSLSLPGAINRQPIAQHPLRTAESFIPLHSNSSPAFHSNGEEEYQDEILNDDPWLQDYNRLRAMRVAEVQAQIAPFAPTWNPNYTSLQGQQSTRSLPILYNENINSNERLTQPHPFNQPVPSAQPFERDIPSRKGVVTLPATGGVFPRYQEVGDVYVDLIKPGGNTGRFKSFFRSRDSRQFK